MKSSVDALIIAKSSILSKMKPVPAQEIPISRNTTPEGHIIQNDPIFTSLPIRIDFKDVLDGRLEAVAETIDEAAQEGLNTILPKVSDHVKRLNDAFGTGIDMNGAPFDHIALRKFVESSETEFDENGVPDFEPWVLTWDELRQSVTFPCIRLFIAKASRTGSLCFLLVDTMVSLDVIPQGRPTSKWDEMRLWLAEVFV